MIALNVVRYGEEHAITPENPPLVLVHGLFGSARNWASVARWYADRMARCVMVVDLRNHGQSPWADSHSYPDMAADLVSIISPLGQAVDLLGHSMGGKAAMWLALNEAFYRGNEVGHERLIRRLVVADIAPISYDDHDQISYIKAMQALDLGGLGAVSRAEADRRLAKSVTNPALRGFFLHSLDLHADPVRWRLNLSVLAKEMTKITGWPETSACFRGASLFIKGAKSNYINFEGRMKVQELFPASQHVEIEGAGHWLHAEKTRFMAIVQGFLGESG